LLPPRLSDVRFFLDEDLEACLAKASCLTYEAGSIRKQKTSSTTPIKSGRKGTEFSGGKTQAFSPIMIEAWGCGGADAIASRIAAREDRATQIQRARTVDKAQFADHLSTFGSKTFAHKDQIDESRR
jgi:hypothetical protein